MTASARNLKRSASRSAARIGAVQALYQMDMAATDANQVISEFVEQRLGEIAQEIGAENPDEAHFSTLVLGVVQEQLEVDQSINAHLAEQWELPRIDSILRAILRSGTFELLKCEDIPARAIINEYVDIGHAFFETEEPKVVNGVLDRLARNLRKDEFD